MNLPELGAALEAFLAPLVAAQGGKLLVAADPEEPFAILAAGRYRGLVAILAIGDADADPDLDAGMEVVHLEITVGQAIDLRAEPGWLFAERPAGEGKSLLANLTELRARVLGLELTTGTGTKQFRNEGLNAVTLPDGTPLRAWKFRASIPIEVEFYTPETELEA